MPRGLALAAALAVAIALGLAASARAERPGWYANPGLSGTPQVGATLVGHFGGLTCTPNCRGTAYEWLSCTGQGSAGADRPTGGLPFDGRPAPGCVTRVPFPGRGENDPRYVPTQEDVGRHIQLHITATNHDCGEVKTDGTQECNDSTGHAYTNTVGPITGGAPAAPAAPPAPAAVLPLNTAPPAITGTPQVGQTLRASTGTWTGTAPIAYTYQWFRCSTALKGCQAITGATRETYTAVVEDVGARITVTVTARNAGGQRAFTAQLTRHVKAAGAAATSAPAAGQRVVDVKTLTPAHRLAVGTVTAPRTVAPSSTALVQVQVKDRRGFLIKGAWVELTGVRGEVGSVTEVTGANGVAALRLKVGPLPDGHELALTITALKPGANPITAVRRITITVTAG